MKSNEIKKLYELDFENEQLKNSNPHCVNNIINDTIIHTQEVFNQIAKPGSHILDLGCGDGKYHQEFFPDFSFTGIANTEEYVSTFVPEEQIWTGRPGSRFQRGIRPPFFQFI